MNFKYCQHCGTKMSADAEFCSKCGIKQTSDQPLKVNYNYEYNPQPQEYRPVGIIISNPGVFTTVGIIIEVVGLFMFGWLFGLIGAYIGYKLEFNSHYHNQGFSIMIAGICEFILVALYIFYKIYRMLN